MAPRLIAKYTNFNCVFETDAATTHGYDAGVYVALVMLDHDRKRHLCGFMHFRKNECRLIHEKFFQDLQKVTNCMYFCYIFKVSCIWQAHDKIDKQEAELGQQLYNPHLYKNENKQAPAKNEKVSFLQQVGIISDGQKGLKECLKAKYPGLDLYII